MPSEQWKNDLGSALTTYAADQTDANWKFVRMHLLTDGLKSRCRYKITFYNKFKLLYLKNVRNKLKQKLINISQIQGGHTVLPVFFKEAIATMEKSIKKYLADFCTSYIRSIYHRLHRSFSSKVFYLSFCKFTTIRDAYFRGLI